MPNNDKITINVNDGKDTGKISDGYHTFDELYEHRIVLFIALCKQIQYLKVRERDLEPLVWRSALHSDGTNFDGWFIVGIHEEPGKQITYHLPMSKWTDTNFMKTLDRAPEFDGHTPQDVLERLSKL